MQFEILGVHTEQISRKKCRLVAARTAANLHHHILAVLWVLREKHQFDLLFETSKMMRKVQQMRRR